MAGGCSAVPATFFSSTQGKGFLPSASGVFGPALLLGDGEAEGEASSAVSFASSSAFPVLSLASSAAAPSLSVVSLSRSVALPPGLPDVSPEPGPESLPAGAEEDGDGDGDVPGVPGLPSPGWKTSCSFLPTPSGSYQGFCSEGDGEAEGDGVVDLPADGVGAGSWGGPFLSGDGEEAPGVGVASVPESPVPEPWPLPDPSLADLSFSALSFSALSFSAFSFSAFSFSAFSFACCSAVSGALTHGPFRKGLSGGCGLAIASCGVRPMPIRTAVGIAARAIALPAGTCSRVSSGLRGAAWRGPVLAAGVAARVSCSSPGTVPPVRPGDRARS